MKLTFCGVCGTKTEKKAEGKWYCSSCKQDYYLNPSPAVELALFNENGEILLSERAQEPNKGQWDLPGGFIDMNETAEEALPRELKEELDLKPNDYTKPLFVRSYKAKYPWGKVTYDIVVFLFVARLKNGANIKAQDDVASVRWARPEDVDPEIYANAHLEDYVQEAVTALANAN